MKDYGEDSDFVRVRVRGSLPARRLAAVHPAAWSTMRCARSLAEDPTAALIMGVDVARFGDDQSVIRFRRGLDAR